MLLASNLSFYPREGCHQSPAWTVRFARLGLRPRPGTPGCWPRSPGRVDPSTSVAIGPVRRRISGATPQDSTSWSIDSRAAARRLAAAGSLSGHERAGGGPRTARRSRRPLILGQGAGPARARPTIYPDIAGQRARGTPWSSTIRARRPGRRARAATIDESGISRPGAVSVRCAMASRSCHRPRANPHCRGARNLCMPERRRHGSGPLSLG